MVSKFNTILGVKLLSVHVLYASYTHVLEGILILLIQYTKQHFIIPNFPLVVSHQNFGVWSILDLGFSDKRCSTHIMYTQIKVTHKAKLSAVLNDFSIQKGVMRPKHSRTASILEKKIPLSVCSQLCLLLYLGILQT